MTEVKKAVIRKTPLFPVFIVAVAVALMIAGNVLVDKSEEVQVQYNYAAE